jgi:hypothetical protein
VGFQQVTQANPSEVLTGTSGATATIALNYDNENDEHRYWFRNLYEEWFCDVYEEWD